MKSWPEFASCQEIRGGGSGCGGSRRSGGRPAPRSLSGPAESGPGAGLRRCEPVRAPGGRAFPVSNFVLPAWPRALSRVPSSRLRCGRRRGVGQRRAGGGGRRPRLCFSLARAVRERRPDQLWGRPRWCGEGGTGCPEPGARRRPGAWERREAPGCYHLLVPATVLLPFASFAFSRRGEVGMSFLFPVSVLQTRGALAALHRILFSSKGRGGYPPSQPVASEFSPFPGGWREGRAHVFRGVI